MKEISKYAAFLTGILVFVLSSTAILFLVLALLASSFEENEINSYFLIAGISLAFITIFFISGLQVLKKNKLRGANFIIWGSSLFIVACLYPALQLILSVPNTQLKILSIVTTLILYLPFIWLIVYLRRYKKTNFL